MNKGTSTDLSSKVLKSQSKTIKAPPKQPIFGKNYTVRGVFIFYIKIVRVVQKRL